MFNYYLKCSLCNYKGLKATFLKKRPPTDKGDPGADWVCPECGNKDPRGLVGSKTAVKLDKEVKANEAISS